MKTPKNNLLVHSLLDFICKNCNIEEEKELYAKLDNFFVDNWEAFPFMVYSHHKLKNRGFDPNKFRNFWNRDKIGNEYSCESITKLLQKYCNESETNQKWFMYEIDGLNYYVVTLKCEKQEILFGFFGTKREIANDVMEYLISFLWRSSKRLQKWKDVQQLKFLIYIDDATDLFNQRKMHKDLDYCIERYQNFKEKFSVLFIDIDHFKNINDHHGHLVGTQLLADMGVLLRKTLRESDLIYRYGGDEFVMIVPASDTGVAKRIGNRILKAVEKYDFEVVVDTVKSTHAKFNLTVSIGVAGFPEDAHSRVDILAMADKMMYRAKSAGRARVCFAEELMLRDSDEEKIKKQG